MKMKSNSKKALKILAKRMTNIDWAVIGSTNMVLQGMDVSPKDIDAVVSIKDFDRLLDIFPDVIKRGKEKINTISGKPVWDIKLKIENTEIQILTEPKDGTYVTKLLSRKIVKIKIDNVLIPCLSLKAEAQAYRETAREQKAELIEDYLKTKSERKILLINSVLG